MTLGPARFGDPPPSRPGGEGPEHLLKAAQAALSSGRPEEALRRLRPLAEPEALRALPRPARAAVLAFQGTAQLQLGDPVAACDSLQAAARLDRRDAGLACSLGAALHRAGRLEEALAAFREGARRDRRQAQAPYGSGVVLHALGRYREAALAFGRALELQPRMLEAWENRALSLSAAGDRDGADATWHDALAAFEGEGPAGQPACQRLMAGLARHLAASGRPADSLPWFRRARQGAGTQADRMHLDRDLALALLQAGRPAESAALLEEVLAAAPASGPASGPDAGLLSTLGAARLAAGDPERAMAALRRALAVAPDHPAANLHAGHALQAMGDLTGAAAHHRRALAPDPGYLPAVLGLANVLAEMDDLAGADQAFAQAQALLPEGSEGPGAAQLRWNRALHDLLHGRYRQGWEGYRSRWQVPDFPTPWRPTGLPDWDGGRVDGRHLFVWGEQGPGDSVMFAGCLSDLLAAGARVTLAVDTRLAGLFRRSFPTIEVVPPEGPVPAADAALPIGDLPRFFRNGEGDFPQRRAYLCAEPEATARWRSRWHAEAGESMRIVALSWRGGVTPAERRRRGAGLADWAPLLRLPGLAWVNLQFGEDAAGEFARLAADLDLVTVSGPDPGGDLDTVAAALAAADATAAMANTLVHLAGALGRPTLVAVPSAPSWRWQRRRSDSPWYPGIRLLRQDRHEPWTRVVERAALALPEVLDRPPGMGDQ